MKREIVLILMIVIIFSACTLAEEEKPIENKNQTEKVYAIDELFQEHSPSKAETISSLIKKLGTTSSAIGSNVIPLRPIKQTSMNRNYNYLNGILLKAINQSTIYLIDRGKKRAIPSGTFYNLFRSKKYYEVIDIYSIPTGTSISSGAILAKSPNSSIVYLISNGQKRPIANNSVFDKYNFNRNAVRKTVPYIVLKYVPTGYKIY